MQIRTEAIKKYAGNDSIFDKDKGNRGPRNLGPKVVIFSPFCFFLALGRWFGREESEHEP